MHISPIHRGLFGAFVAMSACSAQATQFDDAFTGNLVNNTDHVNRTFELDSASDVRLWSDSWSGGLNFDPVSVLWVKSGNDYKLVREVDDDASIAPGQGSYDTGMFLQGLAAGHYLYTVGPTFAEPFAAGTLLSQGYTQDGSAPIPIASWNQPGYDINNNDQKGTLYSLHISSVNAVTAVPEPTSMAMLLAGLGLLGGMAKRRSRKSRTWS